jgi:hypothetical protein
LLKYKGREIIKEKDPDRKINNMKKEGDISTGGASPRRYTLFHLCQRGRVGNIYEEQCLQRDHE